MGRSCPSLLSSYTSDGGGVAWEAAESPVCIGERSPKGGGGGVGARCAVGMRHLLRLQQALRVEYIPC